MDISQSKFQALKERAKAELQRDMNIEKAAELIAQEKLILMDDSIPPALKTAQLKQLNPQVRLWTQKARQPFAAVSGTTSDIDVGPTQSMVSALVKTIQDIKPEEEEDDFKDISSYEIPRMPLVKKKKRRKAEDLTPKPTPTPRRPKRKLPETPLTGIGDLSPDSTQRVQRMRATTTPRQELGKAVKRAVKQGLKKSGKELVKNWLDF